MATIKSYTDLEQSKKLAEILALESADMYYPWYIEEDGDTIESGHRINIPNIGSFTTHKVNKMILPCWSLTALFSVMPQINEWITPFMHKNALLFQFNPKICKIWEHSIIPSYKVIYGDKLSTDIYDNPVDACYEMILKLHELNLL